MATYTANGKIARVLARLEEGPAERDELCAAAGVRGNAGRKLWHALGQAARDGLIGRDAERYVITAAGGHALAVLRSGVDFSFEHIEPRVRFFGRDGAPADRAEVV
jgi:hypothetical protein